MPRFADLQECDLFRGDFGKIQPTSEEMVVCDVRSQLSPSQVVEQKLGAVLRRDADFSLREDA